MSQGARQSASRWDVEGELLFVLSPEGLFLSLRAPLTGITGWDESDWHGRPFQAFVHPDDVLRVKACLSQTHEGDTERVDGVRCLGRDRQFQALDLFFIPRLLRRSVVEILCTGKTTRSPGAPRDPADANGVEQKKLEASAFPPIEHNALLDLLETFLANAPVGFFFVDEHLRYVCVNQPFAAMSGFAPEQHLGKTVRELTPRIAFAFEPALRCAMRNGTSVPDVEVRFPGSATNIEALAASASFYPIFAGTGEVIGVGGLVIDITERNRSLQRIRESEERLHLAMEAASLGTWDWDIRSDRMSWSERARAMVGLSPEADASWDVFIATLHPEDRERVERAASEALRSPKVEYSVEYRTIGPTDGVERWLAAKGNVTFSETGEPTRFVGVAMEITERKRAEESLLRFSQELARSNEALEEFAYVVSHDLKQPLRMVSSFVKLLGDRYLGKLDSDADEFIGYVVGGAKEMGALIDAILEYSRAGKRTNALTWLESETIFQIARENLKPLIDASGADITHGLLPRLFADEAQLLRVFQNLLENALKYRAGAAPGIHVSARQKDKEWLFCVTDNGVGIERENAELIFLPLRRLHAQSAIAGAGLGLTVCRKNLDRLGGRIWLEPREGNGNRFCFTIPVAPKGERLK